MRDEICPVCHGPMTGEVLACEYCDDGDGGDVRFRHKDGHGEHWDLILQKGGPGPDMDDSARWWDYTLSKRVEADAVYAPVFRGRVLGQHDWRPTVSDVMCKVAARLTELAIGFAVEHDRRGE